MYYCNGAVVGVKASGMNFYVAMEDLGQMTWSSGNSACKSYLFCGTLKGRLPTREQLVIMYNNKSSLNNLLSTNGGTKLTEGFYWSSSLYSYGNGLYTVNMSYGNDSRWFDDDSSYTYVRPVLASY